MKGSTRERKRHLNTVWVCVAVSLVLLVLCGFAFLLMNFFHYKINEDDVPNSSGVGHLDSILTVDYQVPNRGHSYDTGEKFPKSVEEKLFSQNEPIKLDVVSRLDWLAHPAKKRHFYNVFSIEKAIILETGTDSCDNVNDCAQIVRELQKSDLKSHDRDDIIYNFLIGGDGSIFEGRGFSATGDHTKNYNDNSLGIALIGKFEKISPTEVQILALRRLLQYSMQEHLKDNYELFGHSQLSSHPHNKNPGAKLFEIIKKWPHWTENTFYKTY